MRGFGVVLTAALASGCGFNINAGSVADDDVQVDATPGEDAPIDPDAPIDAAPIARPLFAASQTSLYKLDVDAKTAMRIGTISTDDQDFDIDGLAFDGTNLLGLSDGSTELLIIDPSTAAVTARRTISPAGTYYGLTVAPAGEAGATAVVFAGAGNKLVTIDPATGAVSSVGTFGASMTFFTDLAWVSGVGLFATLENGSCADWCFARVNATTGTATPFRSNLTSDIWGLSGYRGTLWALHHEGPVLTVNQATGIMAEAFNPNIPWTEAAQ